MTKAAKFTSVNVKEWLISNKIALVLEADVQPFAEGLRCLIESERSKIVLLDFCDIIEAKSSFLDRTIGKVLRETEHTRVVMVNLGETDLCYIADSPRIGGVMAEKRQVILASDRGNRVRWIGSPDRATEKAMTLIYECDGVSKDFIRGELKLSEQDFNHVASFLSDNPQWFIKQAKGKETLWFCVVPRETLLSQLKLRFENELIGSFRKLEVERKGHFVLPSGRHADSYLGTCVVANEPVLITKIAREIWRRSKRMGKPDIILVYSLLGVYIGDELIEIYGGSSKLCVAQNYFSPQTQFEDEIRKDHKVLIITDVTSSGNLITRLRDLVVARGAEEFGCWCVIDTDDFVKKLRIEALVNWPVRMYASANECPHCACGQEFEVADPFTGITFRLAGKWDEIALAIESSKDKRGLIEHEEFWKMTDATNAFKDGHLSFNGRHYMGYVDTRKILRNREFRSFLAQKIVNYYSRFRRLSFVSYPAHESAALLAREIATYLERVQRSKVCLAPACRHPEDNAYEIVPDIGRRMANKAVLFVDDGANSGNTLMGVDLAIKKFKPADVEYCIFIDRLRGYSYDLAQAITSRKLVSIYSLGLPVYTPKECPICNRSSRLEIKSKTTVIEGLREFYKNTIGEKPLRSLDEMEL